MIPDPLSLREKYANLGQAFPHGKHQRFFVVDIRDDHHVAILVFFFFVAVCVVHPCLVLDQFDSSFLCGLSTTSLDVSTRNDATSQGRFYRPENVVVVLLHSIHHHHHWTPMASTFHHHHSAVARMPFDYRSSAKGHFLRRVQNQNRHVQFVCATHVGFLDD